MRGASFSLVDSGGSSDFSSIPLRLPVSACSWGWHFLLLFFPLMIADDYRLPEFLFQRQVTLNASLGVFFVLFGWVLEKYCPRGNKTSKMLALAVVASVVGCVGMVSSVEPALLFVRLSFVVLVGAGSPSSCCCG